MIDIYCWSNRPYSSFSIFKLQRGKGLYWRRVCGAFSKEHLLSKYPSAFFVDFKDRLSYLSSGNVYSILYEEGDLELNDTEPAPN